MKTITQTKLITYVSIFLTLFYNYSFFENTIKVYPLNVANIGFVISTAFVITFFMMLLFTLLSSKYTLKPILIIVLAISSMTSYFMNSYHVVIDATMIRNMMQTDMHESLDLLTIKQVMYFLFFGLLPSLLIYKIKFEDRAFKTEIFAKFKLIVLALVVILVAAFSFSKHYTSFAREHKPLRFSINPAYWMYSSGKYINLTFNTSKLVLKHIGLDAKIKSDDSNRSKIVIMVVGEAARADHFSLNGYKRDTNPLLAKEDIINFTNTFACGTSTAVSVPCMFSKYDRGDYSYKKGISTENVLDVLAHTNQVSILWRDNNSDSKGVALRVTYENYKSSKNNTICTEGECRDIGMLVGLDKYIEQNRGKDILIVLHQMGNHGPAYYKRYTKDFEKFKPTCQTNQLEKCSQEEIANAYDNAILYTDDFLVKTIDFLKQYDTAYDTAMIYMSDHGESLGESGVYLHGLPYFMAPDAQTHIGSVMWFGESMSKKIDAEDLRKRADKEYTQDDLFHTLLGIFDVETVEYDKKMDILNSHR
ncbi:MAG: phosphoethanolamine--lipid A transferase [Sulfurimonas sp.]